MKTLEQTSETLCMLLTHSLQGIYVPVQACKLGSQTDIAASIGKAYT
jgi:hypothetical protein